MKKLSRFLFCLSLLFSSYLVAEDILVYKLVSVYDGDTFKVDLEGEYPEIFRKSISVRVLGIDTPELRTTSMVEKKCGYLAKDYAKKRLMGAKQILLKNVQRDKYFRILADVFIDGSSLAEELIEVGLAVKYDGGTKSDWTELARKYFEDHEIVIEY